MANRTCGLKSPFPENPYLLTDLFSESLKIPVFYRSILVKFYFSLNFILNLIFNKFNSIFRAGIHAVSTLYAVFRAGYNCPFYSIRFPRHQKLLQDKPHSRQELRYIFYNRLLDAFLPPSYLLLIHVIHFSSILSIFQVKKPNPQR